MGDQPNTRPLPTQDITTQKHADTHPCLKQDSNLRSQCSSGHRQCNTHIGNNNQKGRNTKKNKFSSVEKQFQNTKDSYNKRLMYLLANEELYFH